MACEPNAIVDYFHKEMTFKKFGESSIIFCGERESFLYA